MPPSVIGLIACLRDLSVDEGWPTYKTVDLAESSVVVSVRGFVAHLTIDLTYVNGFDKPVEVTYTCPVDAKAAIYHFEAQLDGRTIKGHCLERSKAEKLYKDAVKKGQTAIIAEEDKSSSDVLNLSLGNLGKGERAKLHLEMVQELSVGIDGSVTFTLPTVFNPRYSPADLPEPGPQPVQAFPEAAIATQTRPYAMKVEAEVVGSNKIVKVSSSSDTINFTLATDETTAKITQIGAFKGDHDWSFQVHYQNPYSPHVLRETGDRSSTGMMADDIIMLNLFPEIPVDAYSPHNEIIFLVDRSGSMEGNRIESSKSALLLFLKSLPNGCRFNIVSFGNDFSALFPNGSERYTEKTLESALSLQKSMKADMGGTEILQAMKSIYSRSPAPGYARKILVLTDGEVWNVNEILELVERHSFETQVFSVGIGDGVSTSLIQGLARAGRGRHEIVLDTNILQMKVMGLIASMLQDHVKDLSIEFKADPPQKVTLIPDVPPMIFGGQHLILYARVPPSIEIKKISISGKVREEAVSIEVSEENYKTVHDTRWSLHRMAAKSQLNSWQVKNTEGILDEMVALSVATGVVCRKTAIVGIDTEGKVLAEKEEESPAFGFSGGVPMLGRCFGGPAPPIMYKAQSCSMPLSSQKKSRMKVTQNQQRHAQSDVSFVGSSLMGGFSAGAAPSSTLSGGGFAPGAAPSSNFFSADCAVEAGSINDLLESSQTVVPNYDDYDLNGGMTPQDELLDIVSFQNFDGSWNSERCSGLLKIHLQNQQLLDIKTEFNLTDTGFATVLCLSILRVRFADRKTEWNMIAIKGSMFLQSIGCLEVDSIIDKCSEIIKLSVET